MPFYPLLQAGLLFFKQRFILEAIRPAPRPDGKSECIRNRHAEIERRPCHIASTTNNMIQLMKNQQEAFSVNNAKEIFTHFAAYGKTYCQIQPGKVRELENVVERALILHKGGPLTFMESYGPIPTTGAMYRKPKRTCFPPLISLWRGISAGH